MKQVSNEIRSIFIILDDHIYSKMIKNIQTGLMYDWFVYNP